MLDYIEDSEYPVNHEARPNIFLGPLGKTCVLKRMGENATVTSGGHCWRHCPKRVKAALQEQMKYVMEKSPFYQRKFEEAGITHRDIKHLEDISRVPFSTKPGITEIAGGASDLRRFPLYTGGGGHEGFSDLGDYWDPSKSPL